jgi:branched-chain amino acid transport system substrate-binding protein
MVLEFGRFRTTVSIILTTACVLLGTPTWAAPEDTKESHTEPVSSGKARLAPLRIGFITSQSGVGHDFGKEMLQGINLYLDQHHQTLGGRKVELVVGNDESSLLTSVAKAKELIEKQHVHMLAGVALSHIAYAVAPVAEDHQIPFMLTNAAADDITKRKRYNWVVRTSFSGSQPAHPFGEYVYKTLKYKRVATIAMDYAFGWEQVGGFQKTFEEAGGKVIQKLWLPLGFTDFSAFLKRVRKDADAVLIATIGPAAEIIPKQLKEAGLDMPLIGTGISFDDEDVLPHSGNEVVGIVNALPYSASLNTTMNKQFVQAYRARFGSDPGWFSQASYSSCVWLAKALESFKGDPGDAAKLLAAMKKTPTVESPRGPLKLDSYGNLTQNVYIRRIDRVNGKLRNTVIYTYPMVSQFWKYNPAKFLAEPLYSRDYPPCVFCDETSK